MSDISDPAGAGRGDRRRARKLVDAAYAAGRISAADRSLRVAQIDAASTRGDLAMVTRDLFTPEAPAPAPDLPPASPQDPSGLQWPPAGLDAPRAGQANRKVVKWVLLGAAVAFLLPCVLGLVGLVVTGLTFGDDEWIEPAAPDVTTVAGWNAFLSDVRDDTGSTTVVRAVVGPDGYSVEPPDENAFSQRVVDLADLTPRVMAGLPVVTASHLGVVSMERWTMEISGAGIEVNFPTKGVRRYGLNGVAKPF